MATLSNAKMFGGIGSILIFIPFLSIIGYILIIVAVKDVSDYLGDRAVFNNIIIAAGAGIVGAVAGAAVIAIGVLASGFTFGLSGIAGIATGLFIAWVFLIISAVFLRRAYATMAAKLGLGSFRTAATLYLVGAVLTIALVGFIVLFIAEIVQAIAYFSIPEEFPSTGAGASAAGPSVSPNAMPAPDQSTKFCTNCGTKISPSATFCYSCGAKQP